MSDFKIKANLIIPSQVDAWLAEVRNPKNTQFQRDIYEDRLRALGEYIISCLPPRRERRT